MNRKTITFLLILTVFCTVIPAGLFFTHESPQQIMAENFLTRLLTVSDYTEYKKYTSTYTGADLVNKLTEGYSNYFTAEGFNHFKISPFSRMYLSKADVSKCTYQVKKIYLKKQQFEDKNRMTYIFDVTLHVTDSQGNTSEKIQTGILNFIKEKDEWKINSVRLY